MAFLNEFLSWPLWGRAALVTGSLLLVLLIVRVPLLKVISLLPFLLKKIFRFIYLLLEWLVSVFHKLLGGMFYRVDNGVATFGEHVDTQLGRWYEAWHNPKSWKLYAALTAMAFALCYLFIVIPPTLQIEEGGWQTKGWSAYLWAEGTFVGWLEEHSWYASSAQPGIQNNPLDDDPADSEPEPPQEAFQIFLTVYRVPNLLAIRDVPSAQESTTLGTLKNGTVVSWNGELAFGPAENGQETWAKVTTDSGIEGWTRLSYLHPEESMELTLVPVSVFESAAPIPPDE